ncbi:unnamed protein product [Absidia cylindrospora]
MNASGQNNVGSPPQADFTAEPPKDKKAPWQSPTSPKGENAWDRSKASRDHPEWNTTAYGTTDRWEQHPPSADTPPSENQRQQHERKQRMSKRRSLDSQRKELGDRTASFMESGHTVQHGPSQRSVYRDLNNI